MSKMCAYLALDLGTNTGWARHDEMRKGKLLLSGAWNFKPTRFDSPSVRFTRFGQELRAQLLLGVDKVFYETVRRHRGTDAAHVYGGFLSKLHEVCDEFEVPFEGLTVQEIKKHATGKGNASKDEIGEAVRSWGLRPATEDEADALAILRCAMETKL